jgi:hypothetical protein
LIVRPGQLEIVRQRLVVPVLEVSVAQLPPVTVVVVVVVVVPPSVLVVVPPSELVLLAAAPASFWLIVGTMHAGPANAASTSVQGTKARSACRIMEPPHHTPIARAKFVARARVCSRFGRGFQTLPFGRYRRKPRR